MDVAEEAARQAKSSESKPGKGGKAVGKGRTRRARLVRSLPTAIGIVLLAILVPTFVVRVYGIPSGSMETTLHGCTGCTNDKVLVDKISYRFGEPKRGDVLVFSRPEAWNNSELQQTPKPKSAIVRGLQSVASAVGIQSSSETDLIKRVIAVGGQTVACCDDRNRLLVDGKPVDEPFVYYAPEFGPAQQQPFGPVKVPAGTLWMMGDSRNNSVDSRAQGDGPVPLADVVGRARWIVYPFSRMGSIGARTPAAQSDGGS